MIIMSKFPVLKSIFLVICEYVHVFCHRITNLTYASLIIGFSYIIRQQFIHMDNL